MLALIVIWNYGLSACACVSVCICFRSHYVYYFSISWLFAFASITSNSFNVNSDDFCLLRKWIYELKCSTMKTALWVFEKTEHFQRKVLLSLSRSCCYWYQCENFNGILLSQFVQNIVEVCFKKYNRLRLFIRILV